jgi:MFS family permease
MSAGWYSKRADIPSDLVILLIAGLTMVIAGLLLFAVYSGKVPYYENGLYGLLIFIYALQITVLGKTPFGGISQRTLPVLMLGIIIACIGIVTCFVPNLLKSIPRAMLFMCFGPGGMILLLQMLFSKDKFPLWKKKGGILMKLAVNCAALYSLSIVISILLLDKDFIPESLTAFSVLLYGLLILSLTAVLYKVYALYPAAEKRPPGGISLSDERAVILITGIFMVLLGLLLIPVTFGLLPFSGSAQLGLLVVIMSIQMTAFGNTPLRSFTRTWPLVFLGLLFASMGIISCIVPGIMLPWLTLIIAFLNIGGGAIPLVKMLTSLFSGEQKKTAQMPPVITKLLITQTTLNTLSIIFGTSMLIRNLIRDLSLE